MTVQIVISLCWLVPVLCWISFNDSDSYEKDFKKLKSRTINYGSYKHFSNEAHGESLLHELSREVFVNNDDGLQRFSDININTLNRHAPRKRKLARGNQMPFITKDLSKAITKDRDCAITLLKSERGKQNLIQNKRTTASHFKKYLKWNILQT